MPKQMLKWIIAGAFFSNSVFADHMVSAYNTPPPQANALDNLVVVSNPHSPRNCGIDILEIGFKNDKMPNPDFHIALMRDIYDPTYGPMPPQVRKIYDYNMPSNLFWSSESPEEAEEPYAIVNRATHKKVIVAKLIWNLASFLTTVVPFFGVGYYVTDELIEMYVRRNQYHRRQTTQLLNTIIEQKPEAFQGILGINEVKSVVAVGEEYSFEGLFLNPAVSELVWQYNQDARHSLRAQNYSRLINILNREGLVARPISSDFLVVYYDPNRRYAREFNTLYTDLDKLPNISDFNGGKLVPIGIYAIGQIDQRVLTLDFTDSKRIRNRKIFDYMAGLGVKAGVTFLPMPFSLVVFATDKGIHFVLSKAGLNVLTDIIESEAELAMLFQTGIAQLDKQIIDQAKEQQERNQINVLIRRDGKPETNRKNNMLMAENFLKYHGNDLCEEVDSRREKEYREDFLSFWERGKRAFSKLMPFVSNESLVRDREKIISERYDTIKSRHILNDFIMRPASNSDDVVAALHTVSLARDPDDADLIAKIIEYPRTEKIELAAIEAAKIHRHGNLLDSLIKFLNSYNYDSEILASDHSLSLAFEAIASLDYTKVIPILPTYRKAISFLEEKSNDPSLARSKNELERIKNKLNSDLKTYKEQLWRGQ
ncbi:MAG: hypothetical protein A4S09_11960 [Proteobacteria bacterium SG_bin7]|nr:MAG: hypothetical protein A4S09_11960 [Proteobacteria bacterium SG_bin7]